MMERIGNESTSLISRKPVAVSYPLATAALTFGAVAAVTTFVALFVVGICFGDPMHIFASDLLLYVPSAGCSALIPGCVLGGRILRTQVKPARAAGWGAAVVGLSYLLLPMFLSAFFHSPTTVIEYIYAAGVLAVITGIVTFPIGASTGWYLAVYREKLARPSGCRLHGYGTQQIGAPNTVPQGGGE